jgi:transglutaminase-like putative cysteine protease
MKKKACIILSLLLLVSTILPYHTVVVCHASPYDEEFVIKSSVRFTTYGEVWNFTEEEKAISLYMNNSWQTVYLINSSHPIETVSNDEDRNAIAVLNMSDIRAGESIDYTVFYQVISKPRNLPNIREDAALSLSNINDTLKATYCENSGTWMTNNTELRDLARNITRGETNVLVCVENFVQWIWTYVKYKTHEVPLYPNETLSMKEGDCDDRAILLISLCRIIKIPAYLQVGCIYRSDFENESSTGWGGHVTNVQNHIAWHGWAMVYIPPWGWLPVDLTYVYSDQPTPLDAVRKAAVTSQDVIQYMNIVNTDYATNARQYQSFLQNNGYKIWTYDEMIPGRGIDPFAFIYESLVKYAPLVFLFAVFASCVVVSFVVRRWRKRTPTLMEPTSPSSPVSYTRKPL